MRKILWVAVTAALLTSPQVYAVEKTGSTSAFGSTIGAVTAPAGGGGDGAGCPGGDERE